MWPYILRRLLYNIPVFLGVILVVMAILRVTDPVYAYLGKNASPEEIELKREEMGLNQPFVVQYGRFLGRMVTFDFTERSWELKRPVGEMIATSVPPSLLITVPTLALTAGVSLCVALISAYTRGRSVDRTLMFLAVIGMSISYLVYIIFGQYFGAFWPREEMGLRLFAVEGWDPALSSPGYWASHPGDAASAWIYFCLLPVIIGVIVGIGYDTRFYRAVMVEETGRDYITTAIAKGASQRKIMFVHMLKNAMIPVITRIMITLPFLIEGAVLVEYYFGIPGMGRTLIAAINAKDFPVIQTFTAILAAVFILSNILTDVLYALVDPRVRLS